MSKGSHRKKPWTKKRKLWLLWSRTLIVTVESVSLVLLTWNRRDSVKRSLAHNLKNAGYHIREVVHVDQNSHDDVWCVVQDEVKSDVPGINLVQVDLGYNQGVARG